MEQTPPVDINPADLIRLIERGDGSACAAYLETLDVSETVFAVSRLDEELRQRLISILDPNDAADLISILPQTQVVEAMEDMHPSAAAKIIEELPSDERADLVGLLDREDAFAILELLAASDAQDVRRLAAYPRESAGGLMITEFVQYPTRLTVAQVIEDLGRNAEQYSHYNIQYAYVTDDQGRLVGVLHLRNLLLTPRALPLEEVMEREPALVRDDTSLDDLIEFFDDHRFFGAPVVDASGKLCGVVQRAAVEAAVTASRERDYRRSQGIVGGDELRTMPLWRRSRRRLSWLSVNILLNVLSASVIAFHQDTLEAVIALAFFLPIISDMSGCSGNQAVAVSIRELVLGVIRPHEIWRAIWGEVLLGAINGLVLGLLIGGVAFLWKHNAYLGLVVGSALMLNTIVAVVIGGAIPLILKRLKFDPALAASPILTTVTDMCGFMLVLTLARAMLSHLT